LAVEGAHQLREKEAVYQGIFEGGEKPFKAGKPPVLGLIPKALNHMDWCDPH
jgi:hypothetical protein